MAPVNLSMVDFHNIAANQKAGVNPQGRLQTYPADKPWYGRALSKLASPFTSGTKLEIRQQFRNCMITRYGEVGGQAFDTTLGQVSARSLSGRQIRQVFQAADNLAAARANGNRARFAAHSPGGAQFAAVAQRAGLGLGALSPAAQHAVTQRLANSYPPIHLEKYEVPDPEIANRAVNLVQAEHRLADLLPGAPGFLQIANQMGINPNALKADLADKLRGAVHEICNNGAQPVTVAQIEEKLRELLPAAIDGPVAVAHYYGNNVPALLTGGGQHAGLMAEVGIDPTTLDHAQTQRLDAEISARIADRTAMQNGTAMSPAELRAMAKEVAANMFRPFDVALGHRLPDGSTKTVPLIHLIENAIAERRMRTHPPGDFATTLATMTNEIQNSGVLPANLKDQALTILDGIARKAQAEAALVHAIPGTPFADFDATQLWRLTLDGRFHDKMVNGAPNPLYRGEFGFENEAGYTAGVTNAITSMLGDLRVRLTADRFAELHDIAVTNVLERDKTLGDPDGPQHIAQGFRDNSYAAFGTDSRGSLSRDGLQQAQAKALVDPWFEVRGVSANAFANPLVPVTATIHCVSKTADECRDRVTGILDAYYDKFDTFNALTPQNDRLDAIAECCQALEQSHIFLDANLRNVAFVVLQKLLIENNLSPTIMTNPNIFDGHSVAEIRGAIRSGWVTFNGHVH